jgi:hypothetical protein
VFELSGQANSGGHSSNEEYYDIRYIYGFATPMNEQQMNINGGFQNEENQFSEFSAM